MKRFLINTQKITTRLTIRYGLLVFITLIVMSLTTLASVKIYTDKQSSDLVENIVENIENKLEISDSFSDYDLNDIAQIDENVHIHIIRNGDLIFKTQESDEINIPIEETEKPKRTNDDGDGWIYFNKQFVNKNNDKFDIQVIKDMDDESDFIELLFWIIFILDIVFFLASIVLGFIMSKRALEPIESIREQAKKITDGDLNKRINIEGPDDELKRLAETFNEMISSIEKKYEVQNRFALDASHEIATPLAVINGYTDLIRRWGKDDPEIFNEAIVSIKKEIKNMTNLLDKLLFIARGDNDISKIEKDSFSLDEVISEVVKESKMIYKNFNIRISDNESLSVYADSRLIKEMLRALIDNSVKYSTFGSEILISSKRVGDNFEIEVVDQGMGIANEDLPRILDRFYRVDKARTREIGGAGLGLSIVDWIVKEHGGDIDIESELGKGTKLTIVIPIYKK